VLVGIVIYGASYLFAGVAYGACRAVPVFPGR